MIDFSLRSGTLHASLNQEVKRLENNSAFWADPPLAIMLARQGRFLWSVVAFMVTACSLAWVTSPVGKPWLAAGEIGAVAGAISGLLCWTPLSPDHRVIRRWERRRNFFHRLQTAHIQRAAFTPSWIGPHGEGVSCPLLFVWVDGRGRKVGSIFLPYRHYRWWRENPPAYVIFPKARFRKDGTIDWGLPQRWADAPAPLPTR